MKKKMSMPTKVAIGFVVFAAIIFTLQSVKKFSPNLEPIASIDKYLLTGLSLGSCLIGTFLLLFGVFKDAEMNKK